MSPNVTKTKIIIAGFEVLTAVVIPCRPASSLSLYRLSYPGPVITLGEGYELRISSLSDLLHTHVTFSHVNPYILLSITSSIVVFFPWGEGPSFSPIENEMLSHNFAYLILVS
jgi:hypothetical protein